MKNAFLSVLLFAGMVSRAQSDSSLKVAPDVFEKGMTKSNVQILDVRTSGEYNSGHIRHALQADWTNKDQFKTRVAYVNKSEPVYIYCLVGGRSAAAAEWMREHGFKQVVELQGGINAWKQANKPLEGASGEKQMTTDEYLAKIPASGTMLVDFGAEWCPPCIAMQPILADLQKDPSLHYQFLKVDGGVQLAIMKSLGIDPIPVFIIYKNGKEVFRKEGVATREELAKQLK